VSIDELEDVCEAPHDSTTGDMDEGVNANVTGKLLLRGISTGSSIAEETGSSKS
jgi:hypothetical protein